MDLLTQFAQFLYHTFELLLHFDKHLNDWISYLGPGIYIALFLIVFCETGLVVTPLLPGDSLLFALGALTVGEDAHLNVWLLWSLLCVAGVLGDAVNYAIGQRIGPKIFQSQTSRFFKRDHLLKTQAFYEKYGGKTIIIARFMPIIRTFAPFVAGIGKMRYRRFALFNVIGGIAWVSLFLFAGRVFGNLPRVKSNFHLVIFAILVISVLPAVIEWARVKFQGTKELA